MDTTDIYLVMLYCAHHGAGHADYTFTEYPELENALLEKLAEEGKDASFISLYYGEDVTEEAAQAAGTRFQAVCPNAEISVLPGGQPVYYYIISFE